MLESELNASVIKGSHLKQSGKYWGTKMVLKMQHTEAWFMKMTLFCAACGKNSLKRDRLYPHQLIIHMTAPS